MKILIVAATPFEIAPLSAHIEQNFIAHEMESFTKGELTIEFLITGVGLVNTAYHLGKRLTLKEYNLVINAGIAGAINRDLEIGTVVQVISEQFGDLGVEEADGSFSSIHSLGLIEANETPFQNEKLINSHSEHFNFLPKATAISVNKVHGFEEGIRQLKANFEADIESMEGAAVFLVCLQEKVPFLQIRSISNYVEPRNRNNWNIPLAIEGLNSVLIEMLGMFV